MAKKGFVRGFFGSIFDIRKNVGADQLTMYGRVIRYTAKDLFSRPTVSGVKETFEEAAQRFNLNEKDIEAQAKRFLLSAVFYLSFGSILLIYFIYLVFSDSSVLAILMSLVLSLVMFANSFREHFWYMQMKKRKVGCNFKDWTNFVLKRKGQ